MVKSRFSVSSVDLSGFTARWLLPSPMYLGLSAACRPALADKGWSESVGIRSKLTAAWVQAQAGWLFRWARRTEVSLGDEDIGGLSRKLEYCFILVHVVYDVHFGGCRRLLGLRLQHKPM